MVTAAVDVTEAKLNQAKAVNVGDFILTTNDDGSTMTLREVTGHEVLLKTGVSNLQVAGGGLPFVAGVLGTTSGRMGPENTHWTRYWAYSSSFFGQFLNDGTYWQGNGKGKSYGDSDWQAVEAAMKDAKKWVKTVEKEQIALGKTRDEAACASHLTDAGTIDLHGPEVQTRLINGWFDASTYVNCFS